MAYIISDTHFFHNNILKYNRPQFKSIEEMNENIIEQWNSIISKGDRVFHLGDFAFGQDLNAIEQIIKRLNGSVYLMIGNHDTPAKIELYQKYFKLFSIYKDGNIVFTHCPLHPALLEEISPRSEGTNERFNVHGHNHKNCIPDSRYFNVCWDIEHKIYTLEDIRKKLTLLDSKIYCEHCGIELTTQTKCQPDCTKEEYLCEDCWADTGYSFEALDNF